MQLELGLGLCHHRDHAGVVGAGRELREPDLVTLHEELNAKDAEARPVSGFGQRIGDVLSHRARTLEAASLMAMGCQDST